MTKTSEQTEADNALEDAVKKVVSAYSLIPENAMIVDYFVVGEATLFEAGDSTCEMFIGFRDGHCRLTTALGIMQLSRRHLLAQWEHGEDS